MKTKHKVIFKNAKELDLGDETIDLVVTSPPYPMIEMWDQIFASQNYAIDTALQANKGRTACDLMHNELHKTWSELSRVVKTGGIVCINIGDATRKVESNFQLYSNHARIVTAFIDLEFYNLPNILWRKQTNAPNKFMGSAMLPPSAYVTLEHEYILVFRKSGKRVFNEEEKSNRRASSYFWEERNQWFSDLWDLKGVRQELNKNESRERSAAYPFEIPYRLINMFSVKEDIVLDPFLGTGTTSLAALCAGRNSVGYELDESFSDSIFHYLDSRNLNFIESIEQKNDNSIVAEYNE